MYILNQIINTIVPKLLLEVFIALTNTNVQIAKSINFVIKSAQVKGFLESNQINTKLKKYGPNTDNLSETLEYILNRKK